MRIINCLIVKRRNKASCLARKSHVSQTIKEESRQVKFAHEILIYEESSSSYSLVSSSSSRRPRRDETILPVSGYSVTGRPLDLPFAHLHYTILRDNRRGNT